MTRMTRMRSGFLMVLIVLAASSRATAQAPTIGEVQRVPCITISLQVGSTEKESRQVTYAPPPGWYVRSHSVACLAKYGHSSYAVNTVPQNWDWSSEEQIHESYKVLLDLAAQAQDQALRNRFAEERDRLLSEMHRVRSTHHALVVDATAKGEGFLRGGGGLQLTVTAELVYVGTGEALSKVVAAERQRLGTVQLPKPRPEPAAQVQTQPAASSGRAALSNALANRVAHTRP